MNRITTWIIIILATIIFVEIILLSNDQVNLINQRSDCEKAAGEKCVITVLPKSINDLIKTAPPDPRNLLGND